MFYPTYIDGDTLIMFETETSGAFAKSDLEVRPDPNKALVNCVDTIEKVGRYLGTTLRPMMDELGMEAEFEFSVRGDGHGSVMLGMNSDVGQLRCKLVMKR